MLLCSSVYVSGSLKMIKFQGMLLDPATVALRYRITKSNRLVFWAKPIVKLIT